MFIDSRDEKCVKLLAVGGPADRPIFFNGCCAGNPRLLILILDLTDFFQKLLKTAVNHLYLGLLKHRIGKFDQFEDFLVLFLQDCFL